jgi:prepilin-type N-terminal cleavage/methylation domain-containing protein
MVMNTKWMQRRQQPRGSNPAGSATSRGFSLIEVMVVAAIGIVLVAIAVPNMLTSLTFAKWRGEISDLSGIFQTCRSQAIKGNATQELDFTTTNGLAAAYIDVPGTGSGITGKTQIWMFSQFSKVNGGPAITSTNPPPLNAGTMWGGSSTTLPDTVDNICFNSRGIPCACPATPLAYCTGITNGYAFYFTQGSQWAAVGVSPAGRIKTYFWNGGAWSN